MASYYFQNRLLMVCILFGSCVLLEAKDARIRFRRSTPVVYDIYALDHFIELVEKIENNVTRVLDVATYIRELGYSDDYWTNLVGTAIPLPKGILSSKEKDVLTKMVAHRYDWSRELGVVRTLAGETIAIGHVINGICAGLSRDKKVSLAQWSPGANREVDNLYGATISRDLAETVLAKKNDPSLPYFGPGGSWDDSKCPVTYSRTGSVTKASNAELLGDIDGFLLGYYIPQWVRRGVRLGQLLRMYYSTGICYDMSVASCKRYNKLKSLVDDEGLLEEIAGVAEALYLKKTAYYPNVKKEDITQASTNTIEKFFPYIEKLQNNQKCPEKEQVGCELPANLVFVMDESDSIKGRDFIDEKNFVRDIIDAFNISPRQTKVSIVEFSTSPAIDIDLHEYGSKTRLSCAINNLRQKGGCTHTAAALQLVKDQIYLPLQKGQSVTSKSDVSNNILILLTDGKSNDPDKRALRCVVNAIKNDVRDLTMISVGVGNYDLKELELIATDPYKHVFTANDFTELLQLVKRLQARTCTTPVQMDLDFKKDGNNTVVTAFVYPGSVRYFALAPQFFFGVKDIDIAIKPVFGSLKIYASRIADTPGPSNYTYKLDPIAIGQSMSLHIPDPCAGFNRTTCPPVYLAIHADKVYCACTEPACTVPSQIKFTIQKGESNAKQVQGSLLFVLISLASFYSL